MAFGIMKNCKIHKLALKTKLSNCLWKVGEHGGFYKHICSRWDRHVDPLIKYFHRVWCDVFILQDNMDNMTSHTSNIIFIFMWPIFNVLLVGVNVHPKHS